MQAAQRAQKLGGLKIGLPDDADGSGGENPLPAGQQARVLNEIIAELQKDHRIRTAKLKELLGHTRLEVVAGMALGIALSALLSAWWLRTS